jgi:hypothetical protein
MTSQPLRLGPFSRRRLGQLARRDAATVREADLERTGADTTTPTVAALQARATAYARREEQRFFRRMKRDLAEHRVLAAALREDVDLYERQRAALDAAGPSSAPPAPGGDPIAEGHGPAFEQLRRLERRIAHAHRRSEELAAAINARFTVAQLRAARHFDRTDEKVAVYWGMLRRAVSPAPLSARAPELRRSDWLTTRSGATDMMQAPGLNDRPELDRRGTDVQA